MLVWPKNSGLALRSADEREIEEYQKLSGGQNEEIRKRGCFFEV